MLNWAGHPQGRPDAVARAAAVPGAHRRASRGAGGAGGVERRVEARRRVAHDERPCRLPTLFLSHGSPMHARRSRRRGRGVGGARAARSASPRGADRLGALGDRRADGDRQRRSRETIHDFGGFPRRALRDSLSGARRAGRRRARASALLKSAGIAAGIDGCRGLDHGAWVPLLDVPGRRRTGRAARGAAGARHRAPCRAGTRARAARDEGVLIVGSGHATHNLRDWMGSRAAARRVPYARRSRTGCAPRSQRDDTDALVALPRARRRDAARAHPTDEHFLPLFVAWGAAGERARVERVVEGLEGGVLSMDSYLFHPAAPWHCQRRVDRIRRCGLKSRQLTAKRAAVGHRPTGESVLDRSCRRRANPRVEPYRQSNGANHA